MTNRSTTADLLKGIAVVLMIQVHILELFATHEIFTSETGKFLLFLGGPFCAPIFVVIFGYYIASSKKTAKQLIQRGIKIFLAGMLLNILLNFNLLFHVLIGKIDLPILPFIFGVDILQFAGISLILFALIKKLLDKSIVITLGIAVIVAYLGHYLLSYTPQKIPLQYIASYFYGVSHWSYFPIFPWIAYPLLGYAFYQFNQKYTINYLQKPAHRLGLSFLFYVFIYLSANYAIDVSSNLQEYYHHGILFFIWTFAFLLFYTATIHVLNKRIGNTTLFKYLKWLGQHVTVIYIIQWILIGNIATTLYKTVDSPVTLLVSFLGILTTVSGLTFWYLKRKSN